MVSSSPLISPHPSDSNILNKSAIRNWTIVAASELKALFTSFQKCLDLRDKYMRLSLQRLGDNPRDHDGALIPTGDICDVSGLRADVPDSVLRIYGPPASTANGKGNEEVDGETKWKMHPPAPPPHWHPNNFPPNAERPAIKHEYDSARRYVGGNEEFDFNAIEIPGVDEEWEYALDDRGVFQIYDAKSASEYLYLSRI